MLKIKNIKFLIFLFLGIFLFKWVYDFFGGIEALDLINKKKSKLYLLVLAHIPTLYFDALTWFVLLKKKIYFFLLVAYNYLDCSNLWQIFSYRKCHGRVRSYLFRDQKRIITS